MFELLGNMFWLMGKMVLQGKWNTFTSWKSVYFNEKNLQVKICVFTSWKYVSITGSNSFHRQKYNSNIRTMFPLLRKIHLQAKLCSSTSVAYVSLLEKNRKISFCRGKYMFPVKWLQLFGKYSYQWKNYCC